MTVEMSSRAGQSRQAVARRPDRALRPVVGVLPDGTAYYAPIGEVIADGERVTCHLCGRSLRSVPAHLRTHGWTKQNYCDAFGLERGQSLEGLQTRKLRATAFSARLIFEPAVRDGSAAGRERARNGQLSQAAATAARGRPIPEQRRRKSVKALTAIPSATIARTNSEKAARHLAQVAADAAARMGYPDLGSLVLARIGAGASLASISRDAGLHKDWLARHLGRLYPAAAQQAARLRGQQSADRVDALWLPAVHGLGFHGVESYLRDRHLARHRTVNAIAAEIGLSHHAVAAALRRHGLTQTAHAAKRYAAGQRAAEVAQRLGYRTIAEYVSQRRAAGWTWNQIAAESGQPQTWLRRHAANRA